MVALLEERRANSKERLDRLHAALSPAETLLAERACVYITGSFGRGEPSAQSDLDLFIVGRGTEQAPELSRLNQLCVKADLVRATQELGFPEFSNDGEYLEHYTVPQLIKTLGRPDDDARNTFTARLLLLLESRPLLGAKVYEETIGEIVSAYWRDYAGRESNFMPAFLANDILRLWRTFCVNYEARTQTETAEKKAKRKIKNYKLKHSRLLTCYSALAYLCGEFALMGTVTNVAVRQMVALTPTQRLEDLAGRSGLEAVRPKIDPILDCYRIFLEQTDASEEVLVARFLDGKQDFNANVLGDCVYDLLHGMRSIGKGQQFHRLLLV